MPAGAFLLTLMKIFDYLSETRGELRHVSWPTRQQLLAYTILVVTLSALTAGLLGGFDYLFTTGLKLILL